jgi:hypothetical protein
METMEQKNERNARVQARYDELMREGKRGHYETMFRVVREEVERAHPAGSAMELDAEEAESVHMMLDSHKVPRYDSDSGTAYSLWGRVVLFRSIA